MMKCNYIVLILIYCNCITIYAQEHITGSFSLSAGRIIVPLTQGRGIHLGGQYHLNGYDELCLEGSFKKEKLPLATDNTTGLRIKSLTCLLSLDYARGIKAGQAATLYAGAGLTGGFEQFNEGLPVLENGQRLAKSGYIPIAGVRIYSSIEVVLARYFSLTGRVVQQFLFFGSGILRYELGIGMRFYI